MEWTELVELGEQDDECEFERGEGALCGAPAEYEMRERYVESHLCEEHALEIAGMLNAGLERVYQDLGAEAGESIRPIKAVVICDWPGPGRKLCGGPARYANIVLNSTPLCEAHRNQSE